MNIDGRRGVVNVAVVGSCRSDFHDSRRINNGAKALTSVTEDFDVEEVSNRVAFRLCVDLVGIFHHPKFVFRNQDRRDVQKSWKPQWHKYVTTVAWRFIDKFPLYLGTPVKCIHYPHGAQRHSEKPSFHALSTPTTL